MTLSGAPTGKARIDTALEHGITFKVAPKLTPDDGIDAVRNLLPKCWFDAAHCQRGIDALRQYRKEWDQAGGVFRDSAVHDWTSHPADAFRYGAVTEPQAKNIMGRQTLALRRQRRRLRRERWNTSQ